MELRAGQVHSRGRYRGATRHDPFLYQARVGTRRYLEERGLARPSIPWDEINAVKDEVFSAPDR